MDEFQKNIFKNYLFNTDPDLVWALFMINKQGLKVMDIEPVYYNGSINVATDPNFDVLPAEANALYVIGDVIFAKNSVTMNGQPLIAIDDPFTGVFVCSFTPQTNNTVAGLGNIAISGINRFGLLCASLRWSDSGATVGTYALIVKGYKITYTS